MKARSTCLAFQKQLSSVNHHPGHSELNWGNKLQLKYNPRPTNIQLRFGEKTGTDTMPEVKSMFREVLPKQGQLSMEDVPTMVLCKPKLLPLKSVTLEKLEKMQQEAQEAIRLQELAQKDRPESL
ncbi:hypothetical protein COCON_G00035830 [Conger conger]|uniref:BBSome-interacting protein 1 n=2 Tax=Conger conger TaxID=82655 RepID=A0A9Q1DZM9_CONCO|nr:hypothetical protein COCON_G00035830 [Conger conger]